MVFSMTYYKEIILILILHVTLTNASVEKCLHQKDDTGRMWAKKEGRTQINNYIQYTASSNASNSYTGWLFAKGKALTELYEVCGFIPRDVKAFEQCQEVEDTVFKTYIRYSVDRRKCNNKKKQNQNQVLTKLLSEYKKHQNLLNQIKRDRCKKSPSDCTDLASALLSIKEKKEAIRLLNNSCNNHENEACFILSNLYIENKESHKSIVAFLKGCSGVSKKKCFSSTFSFSGNRSTYKKVQEQLCRENNPQSCYEMFQLTNKVKYLKAGCLSGHSNSCLRLHEQIKSETEKSQYSKFFCDSGIQTYCKKDHKERIDILDDSIQALEL